MNCSIGITVLFIFATFFSIGQTGPAGVGTSATNVLWLKADAGTSTSANGAPVSTWTDQSGNGVVFSQSTYDQRPSYASSLMNGYPAIEFDNMSSAGQNDYFSAPDNPIFDNTSGYSFFTVTRMKGLGDAQSIISKRVNVGNEEAFMIFYYTGNKMTVDIDNDNNRFSNSYASTTYTNKIYDVFYDGSLSAGLRTTIFDQEQLQTTGTESSSTVADKNSPLIIGSTHVGDPRAFNGYISEIIMYRIKVNDAQRVIINNHLSAKYDIVLSSNDFYAGDNPANGNYDRNVAGIGQDANGGNNTQFAPSACAGMGIQSVSGLDNNDYILAGHAFPANSEITTDIAGITGPNVSRWQRIWYIDITNTGAANVTNITFNMNDGNMAGVNLGVVSNYVLVYRATQSGPWTEIATASSITGNQIFFNNQSLTLDGYYTLATKDFTASPLPVELINFNAILYNNSVYLSWQTESENNSDHFEVQRSENGTQWTPLGNVPAHGFSQSIINYSFEDQNPLFGVSYYRLKQVDLNGAYRFSDIRVVDNPQPKNTVILFPNPTSNGAVTIRSEQPISAIAVYDAFGKIVFERSVDNEQTCVFDTQSFESGLYWVEVNEEHYQLIIL